MWLCWGLQNWIYWPRNSEFYDFKYVFNKLISRMLHFRHFRIFGIIRHFPCSFQFYCSFVTCNQLELITLVMIFGAEMHMKELFTWRFMQGIWCIRYAAYHIYCPLAMSPKLMITWLNLHFGSTFKLFEYALLVQKSELNHATINFGDKVIGPKRKWNAYAVTW